MGRGKLNNATISSNKKSSASTSNRTAKPNKTRSADKMTGRRICSPSQGRLRKFVSQLLTGLFATRSVLPR